MHRRLHAAPKRHLAISLSVALSGCTCAQDGSTGAKPEHAPSSAITEEVANPMASFARMMPGEWKMTAPAGTSIFDTWHWGPGRHSMRVMIDGTAASGDPWRALEVVYSHPGREKVCRFGISPFARSVMEGTIAFEGDTAESVVDMQQTGGLRKLKSRWTFDGPDKYHDELLEATGSGGYEPLAAWDRVRQVPQPRATPRVQAPESLPGPSEHLEALKPLLWRTWRSSKESNPRRVPGEFPDIQTTVEYVPCADGIYVRVLAPNEGSGPTHMLDAYVFHHTGAGELRCIALSHHGGVYEGRLTLAEGGVVQLDLRGYEGSEVVSLVMRLDLDERGIVRHRLWSVAGHERTLINDVHHEPVKPAKPGLPTGRP